MRGVPGIAIALNLNYDNLVSEDTLELSQLSNTVKKKEIIYMYTQTHTHAYMQVIELQEKSNSHKVGFNTFLNLD